MSLRLPLDDLPANPDGIDFRMDLAGDVFRLEFRLNAREDRYYMKVSDEDDAVIVSSVPVIPGRALIVQCIDTRRPAGDFFVVRKDSDDADSEPTSGTLGRGFDVVFVPWSEVLA